MSSTYSALACFCHIFSLIFAEHGLYAQGWCFFVSAKLLSTSLTGAFIMSSGKNVLCLEMAFALNMVKHGQTMVMPAA